MQLANRRMGSKGMHVVILVLFLLALPWLAPLQVSAQYAEHVNEVQVSDFEIGGQPGIVYKPLSSKKHCIVVCIHGLTLNAESYSGFARLLAKRGFDVYVPHIRGFKYGAVTSSAFESFNPKRIGRDLCSMLQSLHAEKPDVPIFLIGESLGASFCITAAASMKGIVSGIVCSAPAWRFRGRSGVILAASIGLILNRRLYASVEKLVLRRVTSDSAVSAHILNDVCHRKNFTPLEVFRFLHYTRTMPKAARHIDGARVMILQGLSDQIVKPDGSARLFTKVPSPHKRFVLVDGAEHLLLEEGECSIDTLDIVANWLSGNVVDNLPTGTILCTRPTNPRAAKLLRLARVPAEEPEVR